ncbi:MAG: small ribosomal subunit biogenesis GTPase RsgA [Cellvibrionaceae bacterium]|nr:small ribosomal subunit biogenesis GTPase RsgA [Cellvibrionaceae bacterium]
MSKRKLSRRQAWRIEKIQAERAERASKKRARELQQLDADALGPEQQGLVIAHYGGQVEVEALEAGADGEQQSQRCHLRANLGSIVTGDRVVWRAGQSLGVIEAVLPRQSELSRPDSHGKIKTIAANIDRLVIVIAPYPEAFGNLIDRYLVVAELLHFEPLILINKCDQLSETKHAAAAAKIEHLRQLYQSIDYQTLAVSASTGEGINALTDKLASGTSVFVGQSGVGKSSLINSLIPGLELRVGALSEARQKGTHTTTTAQLFHFPGGGHLIDSPGIREFGLWPLDQSELMSGFKEMQPLLGQCRFRDCQHQREPGCALRDASDSGRISSERVNSYYHIMNSFDET